MRSRAYFGVLFSIACLGCGAAGTAQTAPAQPANAPEAGSGSARALRAAASDKLAALEPGAIPKSGVDAARFELGRKLFFEQRLSADGKIACASCHKAELGGADGLRVAIGVFGKPNPHNSPSIFNVGLLHGAHWRADRESLEDQAARSPLGAASFGNHDAAEAVGRLRDAGYAAQFASAFPGEEPAISLEHFGVALAVYERTLQTPGRWDAFLKGDDSALNAQEEAGAKLFLDLGCAACHSGAGLGGTSLRKFGVVEPYASATGVETPDLGRFDVTKAEQDRFVFKVAMLRDVAETAPYFHDGSVDDLGRAVQVMARVQLGQTLTDPQVADLVAFLKTLSGPAPEWFSPPPM
jgi:cytochrome c peroxidase